MNRPVKAALCAALLSAALSTAAYADTTAVGDIWSGVVPYIVASIGAVITFLVGWVLNLLKTKLGVSIDDRMRASYRRRRPMRPAWCSTSLATRCWTRKSMSATSSLLMP